MERRAFDQAIRIQLPEFEIVDIVDEPDGDGGDGGDFNEAWERQMDEVEMQVMRLENPQVAMLLDAPHEPPIELHHMVEPVNEPQRPRKKRSFWTISKPFSTQPERCALIGNAWRAVQHAHPEERSQHFADYLIEHFNSKNYPNGEGLPNRWGQF